MRRMGCRFTESFQIGYNNNIKKCSDLCSARARSLTLSAHKQMSKWHAATHCMDLEQTDFRYLLSGCNDGSLLIYDLQSFGQTPKQTCKIIGSVKKTSSRAHRGLCSWVQWYPHDTGIFTTSSRDQTVKVWDVNVMKPVETFHFDTPVLQHHLSPVATNSCLIAVGTMDSNVHLVDLKSGSHMQHLRGHKNSVISVHWSNRDANLLVTGCQNGQILAWDVRSAKSLLHSLIDESVEIKTHNNFLPKAHNHPINGLKFTDDGLKLLSVDTEGFMKLWDGQTLTKVLKFRPTKRSGNLVVRSMGVDFACHGSNVSEHLAFVPSEANIEVICLEDGRSVGSLVGHYAVANCCVYRRPYQELYSAGFDHMVLIWQPVMDENKLFTEEVCHGAHNTNIMQDNWDDCE